MNQKKLSEVVDREVSKLGFGRIKKGWCYGLPCSDPILITVGMVKARWGNEFQFWTIVLVDGVFGEEISSIESFPIGSGTVFRIEQTNYRPLFDLDNSDLSDDEREKGIKGFVQTSLFRFVAIASSSNGVQKLGLEGLVMITPPVQGELSRLGLWDDCLGH